MSDLMMIILGVVAGMVVVILLGTILILLINQREIKFLERSVLMKYKKWKAIKIDKQTGKIVTLGRFFLRETAVSEIGFERTRDGINSKNFKYIIESNF